MRFLQPLECPPIDPIHSGGVWRAGAQVDNFKKNLVESHTYLFCRSLLCNATASAL